MCVWWSYHHAGMTEHPIRGILRHRGSSVRWLASKLHMHETLINHYLAGRRPMPGDFYGRVADVLQVPPELLMPMDVGDFADAPAELRAPEGEAA